LPLALGDTAFAWSFASSLATFVIRTRAQNATKNVLLLLAGGNDSPRESAGVGGARHGHGHALLRPPRASDDRDLLAYAEGACPTKRQNFAHFNTLLNFATSWKKNCLLPASLAPVWFGRTRTLGSCAVGRRSETRIRRLRSGVSRWSPERRTRVRRCARERANVSVKKRSWSSRALHPSVRSFSLLWIEKLEAMRCFSKAVPYTKM